MGKLKWGKETQDDEYENYLFNENSKVDKATREPVRTERVIVESEDEEM